jgi:hypothetical protein
LVVDTNIILYHLEGRQPVVELLDRLERLGETLLTHDRRGFPSVPGLRLLDPFPLVPESGPSTAGEKRVPYRRTPPVRRRSRRRSRVRSPLT